MPFDPQAFDTAKRRRVPDTQGIIEDPTKIESSENSGLGAMGGGVLGALAAGRGNPLKVEAISAASAATGDLIETALRQAVDPERSVTVMDALKSSAKEAGLSLLGGGIGQGVVRGAQLVKEGVAGAFARKIARETTPEAQVAVQTFDAKAKAVNIPTLTAAERTDNAFVDFLDNIAKNSILGANLYRKFLVKREGVVTDIAEEYQKMFGQISQKDPGSVGDMYIAVLGKHRALMDAPAKFIRNELEDKVGALNLQANTGELRDFAKSVKQKIDMSGGLSAKRQGSKISSSLMKATEQGNELDVLEGLGKTIPLKDLFEIRTAMLEYQRGLKLDKKLRNSPAALNVTRAIGITNGIIEESLKQPGSSPDLLMAWKTSNKMFRESSNQFADKLAIDILKKVESNPAGLVDAVVRSSKENGFRYVKKAKSILLPDNIKDLNGLPVGISTTPWRKFQTATVQRVFQDSYDVDKKMYIGSAMLNRLHDIGHGTLSEIFGAKTATKYFEFAEALSLIQKKNPIGIGSLGIQFVQMGAAMSLPRQVTGEAVAVILGPQQLAKIMTSREGVNSLIQGIKMERTNPKWIPLMNRLVTMAYAQVTAEPVTRAEARTTNRIDPRQAHLLQGPSITQ